MHGEKPIELVLREVEKVWGKEVWVVNNEKDNYCCKFLHVKAGKEFSYHFHKDKAESFWLQSGRAILRYINTETAIINCIHLDRSTPVEIPRFVPHSVFAEEDSVILEISTFHKDTDSYRVKVNETT